jgi:hypothetical protein
MDLPDGALPTLVLPDVVAVEGGAATQPDLAMQDNRSHTPQQYGNSSSSGSRHASAQVQQPLSQPAVGREPLRWAWSLCLQAWGFLVTMLILKT